MKEKDVEEYLVEEDIELDKKLIVPDIYLMKAHTIMLWKTGYLERKKLVSILRALFKLQRENEKGTFKLKGKFEDVHMNVEQYVINECGLETGGMIQFARSRNDQVIADIRIFLREKLLSISLKLTELLDSLLKLAKENIETVYPLYTHLQPAQPSTIAHWALSYFDYFKRNLDRILETYRRVNLNPMGSAAGSGVELNIDRELTMKLLGFEGIQENTLDVISSRGENEAETLFTLSMLMTGLSRISMDLILYSTSEFQFVRLGENYVTGSSLMPQKKNPDTLEITRGKTGRIYGYLMHVLSTLKDLPSGYSRDMQETKASLFKGIEAVEKALKVFPGLIKTIQINRERMVEACLKGKTFAADIANTLVTKHRLSFREAYMTVKNALEDVEEDAEEITEKINEIMEKTKKKTRVKVEEIREALDIVKSINKRNVLGGPSPESVRRMLVKREKELNKIKKGITLKIEEIRGKMGYLDEIAREIIEGKIKEPTQLIRKLRSHKK